MLIIENIMLALNGLRSNKMRTFLTMLGIIIGICAVITIMTLGQSVTNKFTDSMQSIGASNVTVMIQQKADEDEDGDAAQGMNVGNSPERNCRNRQGGKGKALH